VAIAPSSPTVSIEITGQFRLLGGGGRSLLPSAAELAVEEFVLESVDETLDGRLRIIGLIADAGPGPFA
jgi:hypothetical protein